MQIKRQMRREQRHLALFQALSPPGLKFMILLRSPFYTVVHDKKIDIQVIGLLERGQARINGETDFRYSPGIPGCDLQTVY